MSVVQEPKDNLLSYNIGPKIAEGKTKIVYEYMEDPSLAILYFKDDITAGDGIKRDSITGKGSIHWRTNKNIFELLTRYLVPTHYVESDEERYCVVRRVKPLPLEVVGRRVATGSILKRRPEIKEGDLFNPLVVEFYYKDDSLHDPMLDKTFLAVIDKKFENESAPQVFQECEKILRYSYRILERAFGYFHHQLMDIKLEFGIVDDEIILQDEITADSFRVWPYLRRPDFDKSNVLKYLNKEGMKDKQLYREGKELGVVKKGFEQVAEITDGFKSIDIRDSLSLAWMEPLKV